MEIEVFLEGWHIECCEPPPGVGDSVAWPLLWVDAPQGAGAMEMRWRARPLPPDSGGDPGGLLLENGPITALWRGHDPDAVPGRGCLLADLHGGAPEQMPTTAGIVLSVQVVTQAYRRTAPRAYEPISEDFTLTSVDRSPRRFLDNEPGPDVIWDENGVLIRLALPDHRALTDARELRVRWPGDKLLM